MRRSLSLLKLCLLCAALARGVAIPFAAQRATSRPPDAKSTNDDGTAGKQPSALTETPPHFSAQSVQNKLNAARRLLQPDAHGRDDTAGFDCHLTSEDRQRYTSADDGTWLINDAILEEVDHDLQLIVNCTREGDEIAFDVTGVIQPPSLVIIPWRLTLSSHAKDDAGSDDASTSKTRTRFTCPRENTGIFLVQAASVAFADLVFEGCTTDGKNESQPIVRVTGCNNRDVSGLVSLLRVTFRRNNLVAASGLRMSESSCSELEMVDVEIADNECSSDGCGVLLGKRSNLENCTVSRNRVVESAEQMSSLVYAPSSSTTMIQGLTASENDLSVVRLRAGVLYLSNASFSRNSLDSEDVSEMNVSCVHLVNSSAAVNSASFSSNAGYRGSAIFAETSNLDMSSSVFQNNVGSNYGGCVYAESSNVSLVNTTVTGNSAEEGGFMYALNADVTLENTAATGNSAKEGGFMFAWYSNATLKNTMATNSSASFSGGFTYALNSNVTLENTVATNSNAGSFGGFVDAENSDMTIKNTSATNSSAGAFGGFVDAGYSNVKLENTKTTNTSAGSYGGFIYARFSDVNLERISATNSSAGYDGGAVYGRNLALRIALSHFFSSNSNITGGFAVLEGSSIFLNDSEIVRGRSKNGGAVWMKESNMTARNLSIVYCRADNDGGGVMSFAYSAFLCTDCTFQNNSAERGNGGAVFFDSNPDQNLALQIVHSRFENNEAELGGGLFFVCGERSGRCITNGTDCPFVALTDTKFSSNTAVIAGGGIFAGYLAAIRFNCSNASLDTNLEYYEEKEWQALKRLESEADICPSWKGNNGTVYGTEIGTYAYNATTRIEKDNVSSVCESGGENCVIDGYRAGSDLAKAEVKLIDAFGGGPARNYRTVNAMLSSARGQLIVGSVVLPMEEGNCTFQSIRSFVPPEKYKLTLEFDEDAIEDIGITVIVRECSVGEIVAPGTGICQECSNTTYSFDPLEDVCQQCPENGNCETRVIMPDDGYWHDTPCSDRLHRCLPTSACTFEERSEGLRNLTQNVTNCSLSREWREEYNRVQCAKGHEGPLCGSCLRGYGSGLSARCQRCQKGFVNVALILLSVFVLMGLTGVTVNGTLNVRKTDPRELRRQTAFTRTDGPTSLPSLEEQSERANADGSSDHSNPPNDGSTEGVIANEALLAKWKAVEMFKIILGFTQTTILLASLDVGWGLPLLVVAESAEYISGLASDGNRRSVTCLDPEDPSMHPTALAFAFNVCFVPVVVFFFWVVLWTVRAVGYGNDRPRRYLEKRCMLSLMALWYVTLVPVLKTAMSIGLCVDVDDAFDVFSENGTTKYWAVDTDIKCFEDDHAKLFYFVVLAFICPLYGGLLIVFVLFLRAAAKHLCDKDGWVYETTGFLYRSYSLGRRRYWEVAIVFRKVVIAFMVFCAHLYDSVVPMTGVALVITLAIVAQIVAKPHRTEFKDLNKFELTSMFVSLVTTLVAITLRQEDFPEDITRELSTAACVLLNLITFSVFAFQVLKFGADYVRYSLLECGEDAALDAGTFGVLRQYIGYEINNLISELRPTPADPETAEPSALED